jgi:hypothetical protein
MLQKIKAQIKKEICPYCFETYSLKDTPFRCVSPPERCAPEMDAVRARVWEQATPVGKVLPPNGSFTTETRCPKCNQRTKKRLCPLCHMELPHTTGEFKNLIFAVIGAKESGKSHYLAVLIEQIQNHIGPSMGLLLEPLNDYTIKRYREHFYDPVYIKHRTIDATRSALTDRGVQLPMVFSLIFYGKNVLGQRRITNVVTLVFFDTAGEDLKAEDIMSAVNKYIYRSDGIILLLDPLQLKRVRDQLGSSAQLPEMNTETTEIITRTTNLIQSGRGISKDALIPTPIAVAFSKFDAVLPLVDSQLQLNATPNHDGGFDSADFEAVNSEMQSLVSEWHGNFLLQQVSTQYKKFGFFGITSLGCNPHGSTTISRVLPKRVEDPFLWLLHSHGLIKTARR